MRKIILKLQVHYFYQIRPAVCQIFSSIYKNPFYILCSVPTYGKLKQRNNENDTI